MPEDDETYELQDQLDEHRRPLRQSVEERQRRRLERDFTRIFGKPDPDVASSDLTFSAGGEEPELDRKKVVADVGEAVALTGKYLTGVKAARIGDVDVEQLSVSAEQIAFVVPPGVGPGRLTIVWLPVGGSKTRQVHVDFDLRTSSSNGYDDDESD